MIMAVEEAEEEQEEKARGFLQDRVRRMGKGGTGRERKRRERGSEGARDGAREGEVG